MSFSKRTGLKPASKAIQLEAVDEELRNGLWSGIHDTVIRSFCPLRGTLRNPLPNVRGTNLGSYFHSVWLNYFKKPTDTMPDNLSGVTSAIRDHFFACQWNEVLDFIEFTIKRAPSTVTSELRERLNGILERENSAYRIVGDQICPITSKEGGCPTVR